MKIKILLFLFLLISFGASAGDCEYLFEPVQSTVDDDDETTFNRYYPYNLCQEIDPVDKEAEEYLMSIKRMEGKGLVSLMHEVGDIYCVGSYCGTNKDSFYYRMIDACKKARIQTIKDMNAANSVAPPGQVVERINSDFLKKSFDDEYCSVLSEEIILPYKEVAIEEVARNHTNTIEDSIYVYGKKTSEKMNDLANTMDTFVKIWGDIVRQIEGTAVDVFVAVKGFISKILS